MKWIEKIQVGLLVALIELSGGSLCTCENPGKAVHD